MASVFMTMPYAEDDQGRGLIRPLRGLFRLICGAAPLLAALHLKNISSQIAERLFVMNRPILFALLALLTILIGQRRGLAEPADNPDDPKLAGHFSGRVLGPHKQPLAGARV